MGTLWQDLSKELYQVVERVGKSIVAVDGGSGHTSGGIVWRAGFVLTAAHTLRRDAGIRVILGPERSVQARLAGRDRGTDIALLKLEHDVEEKPAEFGSTANLSVGELTVAIARTRRGNIVASSGIISGLRGEWTVSGARIDQFIRPDLTLYAGFSGGALLGAGGTVLGLNTSGLLRGVPITIPSLTVVRVAEDIASKGHVAQPYIGLIMQPVQIPESLQKRAKVSATTGLLVMHLEPGGPADAGGALLGDILIEMDGQTFEDVADVHQALVGKAVNQEVQTQMIRGGDRVGIAIRIGERPRR